MDEGETLDRLQLTVYRGLNEDGTTVIGPVAGLATVFYYFEPITAQNGLDFIGINNSLMFQNDRTKLTITVQILTDTVAEQAETFKVLM